MERPARRPAPSARRLTRRLAAALLITGAALIASACGGSGSAAPAPPSADRFDARRAFADLRMQVELGPRPAGSEASRELAERLVRRIPAGRFEDVPGGLRNVVGVVPGRGKPILIGAHYDTKDIPGFVGANDGAGGVAMVLELTRVLARDRRACQREMRVVFFDGEESPRGSSDFAADGLRGSRAYVAANPGGLRAMVLADFVADRDLSIPREATSTPALWNRLRRAAATAGALHVFPDRLGPGILDDHTPFLEQGTPAIDLIDFDYPHFHTARDTLDKVSARSLDLVGETLLVLLRRLRAETCRG
jgi:hypothetical protein